MSNSINLNIDTDVLATLIKGAYTLCVAKVLQDPTGEVSNVVMATIPSLEPIMTIKWTDTYQIYATSDPYQEGTVISTGGSKPMLVPLAHSYVMSGWADPPKVINDPAAPANGFCFKNGMECSAVVSVQDPHTLKFVPIYISPEPVIAGTVTLTPIDKVVLWFGRSVTTATMIAVDKGNSLTVDCTDGPQTVSFKAPGTWVGP